MKQRKRDKKYVKLLDFVLTLQNSEHSSAVANHMLQFCLEKCKCNKVSWKRKWNLLGYQKVRWRSHRKRHIWDTIWFIAPSLYYLQPIRRATFLKSFKLFHALEFLKNKSWTECSSNILWPNVKCQRFWSINQTILYLSWIFWGLLQRVSMQSLLGFLVRHPFCNKCLLILHSSVTLIWVFFFCIILMSEYLCSNCSNCMYYYVLLLFSQKCAHTETLVGWCTSVQL